MSGTMIRAVGPASRIKVPRGANVIDCKGGSVLPAFWNSHVHFTEAKWQGAAETPAAALSAHLQGMLTRYGFAYVVDTGSDLGNTLALRRRIEAGEIDGPAILTAGTNFVPADGTPFYLVGVKLPELKSAEQARAAVAANFKAGADAVKMMTVSLTARRPYPALPVEVVRAATSEAHRRGKQAFAHPTNEAGVRLAIDGGVDVLLHTSPLGGPWSDTLIAALIRADVALTPTIKLWSYEAAKAGDEARGAKSRATGLQQLRAFASAGGRVLFGTDVGYMTDYDPSDEYEAMAEAGLPLHQILASLTSTPARLFKKERTGQLARGMDADIVVLEADPASDIRALSRARQMYRRGRLIYASLNRVKDGQQLSPEGF